MNTLKDFNKNELNNTFAEAFNERVKEWLYKKGSDTFQIDGDEYKLVWDSVRDTYEVWLDGELLAWNDNHKDFRSIGDCISSHRKLINSVERLMNASNLPFDKNFQKWNCEQLNEFYKS